MKLGDICAAPCFPHAQHFEIPASGCSRERLKFAQESDRDFYAVLLRNHAPEAIRSLSPRIAIVGLSPAATQIEAFVARYRASRSYAEASVAGAFAGLTGDIIAMLKGLGVTQKLGLTFPEPSSLAGHPGVYVTSLIACATLTVSGGSDDFDPGKYASARRCITKRFVGEILSPGFRQLGHIFVLGSKAWPTLESLRMDDGRSVLGFLRGYGKTVLKLPHPSGQNREYVNLASWPAGEVPPMDEYVSEKWAEYRAQPPRKGRVKEPEAKYKAKRRTVWQTVQNLRDEIAQAAS